MQVTTEKRQRGPVWAIAKLLGISVLILVAVVCGAILYDIPRHKPPREQKLIENFYAHRAAYEHLRNMLIEDKQLLRVASWGVQTKDSLVSTKPPQGDFPLDRYNEYIALLNETRGTGAYRANGDPPESVGIDVFASGWAGESRHVDICWLGREPINQITSLDDFYKTAKPRHPVYRHIDGNWYLYADW